MTLPERITDRIVDIAGCWEWQGARNHAGYGWVHFDGRARLAHRVVYSLLVGPIPDGLDLDHLCRNPPCCNPAHLEPVTRGENLRRSPSWNGNRTECKSGHPLDGVNVTLSSRFCRTCARETRRQYMRRRRDKLRSS